MFWQCSIIIIIIIIIIVIIIIIIIIFIIMPHLKPSSMQLQDLLTMQDMVLHWKLKKRNVIHVRRGTHDAADLRLDKTAGVLPRSF